MFYKDDSYVTGPARKTFRTFYHNKIAYCLPGFYFNSMLLDCNFVQIGKSFLLPGN